MNISTLHISHHHDFHRLNPYSAKHAPSAGIRSKLYIMTRTVHTGFEQASNQKKTFYLSTPTGTALRSDRIFTPLPVSPNSHDHPYDPAYCLVTP